MEGFWTVFRGGPGSKKGGSKRGVRRGVQEVPDHRIPEGEKVDQRTGDQLGSRKAGFQEGQNPKSRTTGRTFR